MKTLILSVFVLTASITLANTTFVNSQQLPLNNRPDGKPSFRIQYAYDSDMVWAITYSTSITGQALAKVPDTIYWNILNQKTNKLINSWTEVKTSALVASSLGITEKTVVAELLPNLKFASLVFSVKDVQYNFDVIYSFPIGPLCTNHPTHFLDLTNTSKRACTVTANDIPDFQSECKELAEELLGYVNGNLISCEIAKKKYSKDSCGVLSCP